jgi:endoglucanase
VVPAQVKPPLHGLLEHGAARAILVDDRDSIIKLVGVNWYGAESSDLVPGGLDKQSATAIAQEIKRMHFNSVRLPFSNYLVECNPIVSRALVSQLKPTGQLHALEVYDQVVAALASEGLMVILDDHSSDPTWSPDPNDALWFNGSYSSDQWIRDWVAMAHRYRGVPAVIGADLRNEPTGDARWGGGTDLDWRQAAERAGNALLSASGNPNLLVMVEGIGLGVDLSGAERAPICLQPGQSSAYSAADHCPPATATSSLVYSAHDYTQSQDADVNKDYTKLTNRLGNVEGWNAAAAAAPLWIGEFGTCNTSSKCVRADANSAPAEPCANANTAGPVGTWFANFTDYVAQHNLSWAYWPLNGTQSSGGPATTRDRLNPDCYGLLDTNWDAPAPMAADLLCALRSMINPSAATYPADGCAQATASPPVPSTGGASAATSPTVMKKFEPWGPVGANGGYAPSPGLIVADGGNATCDSGSTDDPGSASAVRCLPPGNGTPCFIYTGAGDPSNPLLCSTDPTSNHVTEVRPTGEGVPVGMLNSDDPTQSPWFLILADGRKCSFQGYRTNTNVLSYYCGGTVSATLPDRSNPTWTVQEGTNQAKPTRSTPRIAVLTAYR